MVVWSIFAVHRSACVSADIIHRVTLPEMNEMTDLVFSTLLEQDCVPMMVAASSVHAVDGAYSVEFGQLGILSERRFSALKEGKPPPRILPTLAATPGKDGAVGNVGVLKSPDNVPLVHCTAL
eukprot:SAG11_NODE_20774_length_438_cov_1.215339_1_plen_122_part_01